MKSVNPLLICIALAFVFCVSGCAYYKVYKSDKKLTPAQVKKYINKGITGNYYFVLHVGKDMWHMENVAINQDSLFVKATLSELSPRYQIYNYHQALKRHKKFNKYDKKIYYTIKEFHLVLNDKSISATQISTGKTINISEKELDSIFFIKTSKKTTYLKIAIPVTIVGLVSVIIYSFKDFGGM